MTAKIVVACDDIEPDIALQAVDKIAECADRSSSEKPGQVIVGKRKNAGPIGGGDDHPSRCAMIAKVFSTPRLAPIFCHNGLCVLKYRTISTLVEIRIMTATISWQFRNFLGERYSQVPTFILPRQTNFYGVRWEFFN